MKILSNKILELLFFNSPGICDLMIFFDFLLLLFAPMHCCSKFTRCVESEHYYSSVETTRFQLSDFGYFKLEGDV